MGVTEDKDTKLNENGPTCVARTKSEASKMLEAALLQMDGIISGVCTEGTIDGSLEWKDPVKEATRNLISTIKSAQSPPLPPDSTSHSGSTMKDQNSYWTPTDAYDSSGTSSSTSNYDGSQIHDYVKTLPNPCPKPKNVCLQQTCPCQACLMGYTGRIIDFQGSLPNVYATPANMVHLSTIPLSCSHQLPSHANNSMHYINVHPNIQTDSVHSLSGRLAAISLDRRRRRLKNKIDPNQKAKSHNDLTRVKNNSVPQRFFSYPRHHRSTGNISMDSYHYRIEERVRKLENERSALHMEVSVLSEQVEAQSNKIVELESILQEKKDSLKQMDDSLQKEVLLRSALETQRLELLTSLSEMKLQQASLERENVILRNANVLSNGERFSRHAGQYSSLPRQTISAKKGVAFADKEKTIMGEFNQNVGTFLPKPLVELSVEEIEEWLSRFGLKCYADELKRWGATGSKLLDSTANQIEKELEIKNPLHRKKLLYAIESEKFNGEGFFGSNKMDNGAVLRWLDDIGLPQHKEAFLMAKVDGRMLHRLTTEDLLNLGVIAQLHVASLRRGIQVLRELNFEFDNLERRSLNGNGADGQNVTLWTNHRVMEWLRVVDLAEYAPNMRGSGVHGGLMVYEGRFTAELLATLLSIPPAKTLLRRHLTTHFNQIVGKEVVQHKREMETTLGFTPLTLTAKLKAPKKSQFTLKRKKSKNEADFGSLVCPLEGNSQTEACSTPSSTPSSPNMNSPTI